MNVVFLTIDTREVIHYGVSSQINQGRRRASGSGVEVG
jgi:hypothetical protein